MAIKMGGKLPKAIADAPELLPGLDIFMQAFEDLSVSRPQTGFGPGPISWFAIQEYSRLQGFDAEELEFNIRYMDKVYLDFAADEIKRKQKAGSKSG